MLIQNKHNKEWDYYVIFKINMVKYLNVIFHLIHIFMQDFNKKHKIKYVHIQNQKYQKFYKCKLQKKLIYKKLIIYLVK